LDREITVNQLNEIIPYQLVYYGSDVLRKVADEVTEIDQGVADLVENMFHVMKRERGIGLAAPQVGISQRIIAVNLEVYKGPALSLINPEIIGDSGDETVYEEGCLSVPGIMRDVVRPGEISVKGLTLEGKEVQIDAEGLLARVLQHEIDHINGILFIDHLEDYVRKELTQELKKIKKLNKK